MAEKSEELAETAEEKVETTTSTSGISEERTPATFEECEVEEVEEEEEEECPCCIPNPDASVPEWTEEELPFLNEQTCDFSIRVPTDYNGPGGSELEARLEEAIEPGLEALIEHYGKASNYTGPAEVLAVETSYERPPPFGEAPARFDSIVSGVEASVDLDPALEEEAIVGSWETPENTDWAYLELIDRDAVDTYDDRISCRVPVSWFAEISDKIGDYSTFTYPYVLDLLPDITASQWKELEAYSLNESEAGDKESYSIHKQGGSSYVYGDEAVSEINETGDWTSKLGQWRLQAITVGGSSGWSDGAEYDSYADGSGRDPYDPDNGTYLYIETGKYDAFKNMWEKIIEAARWHYDEDNPKNYVGGTEALASDEFAARGAGGDRWVTNVYNGVTFKAESLTGKFKSGTVIPDSNEFWVHPFWDFGPEASGHPSCDFYGGAICGPQDLGAEVYWPSLSDEHVGVQGASASDEYDDYLVIHGVADWKLEMNSGDSNDTTEEAVEPILGAWKISSRGRGLENYFEFSDRNSSHSDSAGNKHVLRIALNSSDGDLVSGESWREIAPTLQHATDDGFPVGGLEWEIVRYYRSTPDEMEPAMTEIDVAEATTGPFGGSTTAVEAVVEPVDGGFANTVEYLMQYAETKDWTASGIPGVNMKVLVTVPAEIFCEVPDAEDPLYVEETTEFPIAPPSEVLFETGGDGAMGDQFINVKWGLEWYSKHDIPLWASGFENAYIKNIWHGDERYPSLGWIYNMEDIQSQAEKLYAFPGALKKFLNDNIEESHILSFRLEQAKSAGIEKIKISFTDEYKIQKVTVNKKGCPPMSFMSKSDHAKAIAELNQEVIYDEGDPTAVIGGLEYGKNPFIYPEPRIGIGWNSFINDSETGTDDPRTMAYLACVPYMYTALQAEEPVDWQLFFKTFTYPEIDFIEGEADGELNKETIGCIPFAGILSELSNVATDTFSQTLIRQFDQQLCQTLKELKDTEANRQDDGNPANAEWITAFKVASKAATAEIMQKDPFWRNLTDNLQNVGSVNEFWADVMDALGHCGWLAFLESLFECLTQGMDFGDVLEIAVRSALEAMEPLHLERLLVGLPSDVQRLIAANASENIPEGMQNWRPWDTTPSPPSMSKEEWVADEMERNKNVQTAITEAREANVPQESIDAGIAAAEGRMGAEYDEIVVFEDPSKGVDDNRKTKTLGKVFIDAGVSAQIQQAYSDALMDFFTPEELYELLMGLPGAALLGRTLDVFKCPNFSLFSPRLATWFKHLESAISEFDLGFCKEFKRITWPSPFWPSFAISFDPIKAILIAAWEALQLAVMEALVAILKYILELLFGALCSLLGALGALAGEALGLISYGDMMDMLTEALCGEGASEADAGDTIAEIMDALGVTSSETEASAEDRGQEALAIFVGLAQSMPAHIQLDLFSGTASKEACEIAAEAIRNSGASFADKLGTCNAVKRFYKSLGQTFIGQSNIDNLQQKIIEAASCITDDYEPSLCQIDGLSERGKVIADNLKNKLGEDITDAQIEKLVQDEEDKFLKQLAQLGDLHSAGDLGPLVPNIQGSGSCPPGVRDPTGIVPRDSEIEAITSVSSEVVEGIFSTIKTEYEAEVNGVGGIFDRILSDKDGLSKHRHDDHLLDLMENSVHENPITVGRDLQAKLAGETLDDIDIEGGVQILSDDVGDYAFTWRTLNGIDLTTTPYWDSDTSKNQDFTAWSEAFAGTVDSSANRTYAYSKNLERVKTATSPSTYDTITTINYGPYPNPDCVMVYQAPEFDYSEEDNRTFRAAIHYWNSDFYDEVYAGDTNFTDRDVVRLHCLSEDMVAIAYNEYQFSMRGLHGNDSLEDSLLVVEKYIDEDVQQIIIDSNITEAVIGEDGVSQKNSFFAKYCANLWETALTSEGAVWSSESVYSKYKEEYYDLISAHFIETFQGIMADNEEAWMTGLLNFKLELEPVEIGTDGEEFMLPRPVPISGMEGTSENVALDENEYGPGSYYVHEQFAYGWAKMADEFMPSASNPCEEQSAADIFDWKGISDHVSEGSVMYEEDERIGQNPDCAWDPPYDRIMSRTERATIEGGILAMIRTVIYEYVIKTMAANSMISLSNDNYGDLFSEFIAATVQEQMFQKAKTIFGNIPSWWRFDQVFLEQAVCLYVRGAADGKYEINDDILEAVDRIDVKINELYVQPSFDIFNAKKIASWKHVMEDTRDDAMLILRYLIKAELSKAFEKMDEFMQPEITNIHESFIKGELPGSSSHAMNPTTPQDVPLVTGAPSLMTGRPAFVIEKYIMIEDKEEPSGNPLIDERDSHLYGVVNLSEWDEFIASVGSSGTTASSVADSTIEQHFGSWKFGLRICFVDSDLGSTTHQLVPTEYQERTKAYGYTHRKAGLGDARLPLASVELEFDEGYPIGDFSSEDYNDEILQCLIEKLIASAEYRAIFDYALPMKNFLALPTIYLGMNFLESVGRRDAWYGERKDGDIVVSNSDGFIHVSDTDGKTGGDPYGLYYDTDDEEYKSGKISFGAGIARGWRAFVHTDGVGLESGSWRRWMKNKAYRSWDKDVFKETKYLLRVMIEEAYHANNWKANRSFDIGDWFKINFKLDLSWSWTPWRKNRRYVGPDCSDNAEANGAAQDAYNSRS
jgi:predicted RNase H-like HicB family nuclease